MGLADGAPAAAEHGGRPFRVEVSGADEVSPTPGGAADWGTFLLRLNAGHGRLCWTGEALVRGSGGDLPSHGWIRNAPAESSGSVVLSIFGHHDYPQTYPTAETCVDADRALLRDMIQNPQSYYIHLDNHQYGGRFVRGQLA